MMANDKIINFFFEKISQGDIDSIKTLAEVVISKEQWAIKCVTECILKALYYDHNNIAEYIYNNMLKNKVDFIEYSIKTENFKILDWIKKYDENKLLRDSYIIEAVINGNLEMLKWFYKNGYTNIRNPILMAEAAKNNHLHIIKWGHENNFDFNGAKNEAATYGHLELLKWLHENRISDGLGYNAMILAARDGHFEVVKFLYEHYKDICNIPKSIGFAKNKHPEIVEWLQQKQRMENTEKIRKMCNDKKEELLNEIDRLLKLEFREKNNVYINGFGDAVIQFTIDLGRLHIIEEHDYRIQKLIEKRIQSILDTTIILNTKIIDDKVAVIIFP